MWVSNSDPYSQTSFWSVSTETGEVDLFKKTIKFPNTTRLGVRLENNKPKTTIFWDEMSCFEFCGSDEILIFEVVAKLQEIQNLKLCSIENDILDSH